MAQSSKAVADVRVASSDGSTTAERKPNDVDYTAPTSVPITASRTFTGIDLLSYKDGTVTVTLVPAPGYVIGRTRSLTLTFQTVFPSPNCEHETVRRTTTVGHAPAAAGPLFLPGSEPGQSSITKGHLPPGLSLDFEGNFSGRATTTGTFTYSVFHCFEDICTHEFDVVVTVLPAGASVPPPGPPPTAPPAQPISAPAEFTG